MTVLVDTNVLLRLFQPADPHSPIVERALNFLRQRNDSLFIAAQNIFEFWAVCTRPAGENGLGLTAEEAAAEVSAVKGLFAVLPELPLLDEWERLVTKYNVVGRNSHDARLVAAMRVHGIESMLTFNTQDFRRYTEISLLDPGVISRA